MGGARAYHDDIPIVDNCELKQGHCKGRGHALGQCQRPSLRLSNCLPGHLPPNPPSEKCALCLKSPLGQVWLRLVVRSGASSRLNWVCDGSKGGLSLLLKGHASVVSLLCFFKEPESSEEPWGLGQGLPDYCAGFPLMALKAGVPCWHCSRARTSPFSVMVRSGA